MINKIINNKINKNSYKINKNKKISIKLIKIN